MKVLLQRTVAVAAILLTLTGGLGYPVSQSHAEESASPAELNKLINASGRQRMLSQRMAKEINLIAYGHQVGENLSSLQKNLELFDSVLAGMQQGNASLGLVAVDSPRLNHLLKKVVSIWNPFKAQVSAVISAKASTPEEASAISELSIDLLKASNKVVGQYERIASQGGEATNQSRAVQINLAGRQRMLSQRMSKEYFLILNEQDVGNQKLNLLESITLFKQTHEGLISGDDSIGLQAVVTGQAKAQLEVVDTLWSALEPVFTRASHPDTQAFSQAEVAEVAQTNVKLLVEMNKAVNMLEHFELASN